MNNLSDFWQWLGEDKAERAAFEQIINANYRDMTARQVYADWLQERDLQANQDSLNFLRFNRRAPIFRDVGGKIWVGYEYRSDEIEDIMRGQSSHFFSPTTKRSFSSRLSGEVANGPGGTWFVTSERPIQSSFGSARPRRVYSVRQFIANYEDGKVRYSIGKGDIFSDLNAAKRAAKRMAAIVTA